MQIVPKSDFIRETISNKIFQHESSEGNKMFCEEDTSSPYFVVDIVDTFFIDMFYEPFQSDLIHILGMIDTIFPIDCKYF